MAGLFKVLNEKDLVFALQEVDDRFALIFFFDFGVHRGFVTADDVFVIFQESRSEEHTSELQSHHDLVCRLLLEKKNDVIKENENLCAPESHGSGDLVDAGLIR